MNLQFQQLSNQVRPSESFFMTREMRVCFYCRKKPGHLKNCRKLKWDLEKERKQKKA